MNYLSFKTTDSIFSACQQVQIHNHPVLYPELKAFSLALRRFEKELGEEREDSHWKAFCRRLRRYRYELCVAPLPANHSTLCTPEIFQHLEGELRYLGYSFPQLAEDAVKVLDCAKTVFKAARNPYWERVISIKPNLLKQNVALLLKETAHLQPVEQFVIGQIPVNMIEVVGVNQLRSEPRFGTVVIFGPKIWFPEFVFTAPRATSIQSLSFDWLYDHWKPQPLFVSTKTIQKSNRTAIQSDIDPVTPTQPANQGLLPEEVLPVIDWDRLTSSITFSSQPDFRQELVEARLFILDGGFGVFLDTDEGTSVIVIDPEAEQGSQVKRIPSSSLDSGMFVLLRTGGGGDYIQPLANQILGENAGQYREKQRLWKEKLAAEVWQQGTGRVIQKLRELGAVLANEINLRNWISYRSIKPKNYLDFQAILRLIKIGLEADQMWETMEAIFRAHRRAGQQIRKLLLQEVQQTNLCELERFGRYDFELPDVDGGSLTAFRIVGKSQKLVSLPESRLARPIEIKDELWS